MSSERPALRVALWSLGAAALALATITLNLGTKAHHYDEALTRASALADGTVVADGIGNEDDIRVRWVDGSGGIHKQRFSIYATDRYTRDSTFRVRYDPAHPGARAFPADPEETSEFDDLWVPILLAAIVGIGFLGGWVWRGAGYWWAARRPTSEARAAAFNGDRVEPGSVTFGRTMWLKIAREGDEHNDAVRWQRVMWHPILDEWKGDLAAVVRGDLRSRRRVVVELAEGHRFVPVGRLRVRPPKRLHMTERSEATTRLIDFFILPEGTESDFRRVWWRRGLVLALVGLALGAVIGFAVNGLQAVVVFAACLAALFVNIWGLHGAEP